MNLTLNEKLRFQKQAGIINESQYKKLLKEEEMSPSINFDRLKKILNQASEVTSGSGKKLLNGDINKFLKFIQLAITSLENQDVDWGDKVTGTPLLYMLLNRNYNGQESAKWEAFNEVMVKFSEASYESEHGRIPKRIIDELREALTALQQYIDTFDDDYYSKGVSGREFEKKEIKDWFKFAPICHILVNDNGNEYTVEFNDVNKALEFVDSLPETAEIML
jgi:hypothetical protein